MISLARYDTPQGPCGYRTGETWQFEHELVATLALAEYMDRLRQGWRHFGHLLFRPKCPACTACRSLRIDVRGFRPNRSQRRNRAMNEPTVQLTVGRPSVSRDKLGLYDRFHAHQTAAKGWPDHEPKDPADFRASFVQNPFPVEEWQYDLDGALVGLGYVDRLSEGLSLIYFVYEPAVRHRGLGTWNVLCAVERASELGLPHVYLGYHVADAPSLAYKANFVPNEVCGPEGTWQQLYG
jgi:arginine-tRNA-protein transferase